MIKKPFLYYFIILFIFSLTACNTIPQDSSLKTIEVGDTKVKVEIANTPQLKAQGLSNRQSLSQNQGMLFVFNNYSKPGFWMKDMQFPIDIIWIKDNTIVDITKNIPPPKVGESLKSYYPQDNTNYVLEVNAGWCDDNKIKIGDIVEL